MWLCLVVNQGYYTQIYWPDDELANIVWECLGPYFAGDRTMEDTVRMLDSRVGLYVIEMR